MTTAEQEVLNIVRAYQGRGPTGDRAVWCMRSRMDGTCVIVDNGCAVRHPDGTYGSPVIASGATWGDVLANMPGKGA